MKKYIINYSLIGSGEIEIVANDLEDALEKAWDVTDEVLKRSTEFSDGFSIESVEDEDGRIYDDIG